MHLVGFVMHQPWLSGASRGGKLAVGTRGVVAAGGVAGGAAKKNEGVNGLHTPAAVTAFHEGVRPGGGSSGGGGGGSLRGERVAQQDRMQYNEQRPDSVYRQREEKNNDNSLGKRQSSFLESPVCAICIHANIHTYPFTCMHIHTHTSTYIYTHICIW